MQTRQQSSSGKKKRQSDAKTARIRTDSHECVTSHPPGIRNSHDDQAEDDRERDKLIGSRSGN
jgi:hypothetical protein